MPPELMSMLPKMGDAAGAGFSLATGAIQNLQALKLKNKADAAMPELIDPNQASYLANLNQKRKSIETGADFSEATRQADVNQAAANSAILGASGGDSGSAIQGLLQAQNVAGTQKNKAIAQGQNQQFAYDTAYGNMLNQISARSLQLQLLRSQQARAEWAQKKQMANQNTNAGIGRLLSGVSSQQQSNEMSGSNFPTSWSADSAPASNTSAGIPQISNLVMGGQPAPTVVPENNLAIAGLGPQL